MNELDRLEFDFTSETCRDHGIDASTKRCGLDALEAEGVIRVTRQKGRVPKVSILDPISFTQLPFLLESEFMVPLAAMAKSSCTVPNPLRTPQQPPQSPSHEPRPLSVANPILNPTGGIVSLVDVRSLLSWYDDPVESGLPAVDPDTWWSAFAAKLGSRYGTLAPFELRPQHVMGVAVRVSRTTADPALVKEGVEQLICFLDWCFCHGHVPRWQARVLAYVLSQNEDSLASLAGCQATTA